MSLAKSNIEKTQSSHTLPFVGGKSNSGNTGVMIHVGTHTERDNTAPAVPGEEGRETVLNLVNDSSSDTLDTSSAIYHSGRAWNITGPQK